MLLKLLVAGRLHFTGFYERQIFVQELWLEQTNMEISTSKIIRTSWEEIVLLFTLTWIVTPSMPARFPRNGIVGCTTWQMTLPRKYPQRKGSLFRLTKLTKQAPNWNTFLTVLPGQRSRSGSPLGTINSLD